MGVRPGPTTDPTESQNIPPGGALAERGPIAVTRKTLGSSGAPGYAEGPPVGMGPGPAALGSPSHRSDSGPRGLVAAVPELHGTPKEPAHNHPGRQRQRQNQARAQPRCHRPAAQAPSPGHPRAGRWPWLRSSRLQPCELQPPLSNLHRPQGSPLVPRPLLTSFKMS